MEDSLCDYAKAITIQLTYLLATLEFNENSGTQSSETNRPNQAYSKIDVSLISADGIVTRSRKAVHLD